MSTLAIRRTEKRRTQIIALLNRPNKLTDLQIRGIVGCSTNSVQRTRNRIKPALSEIQDKVEEYRRLLDRELPIEYRVKRLRELAEQDSQLMVALNNLERIEAIDGLMGRTEYEEAPRAPSNCRKEFLSRSPYTTASQNSRAS